MTDVLEKLAACERAENEGRAYPFFPEIWGEARGEIERLREALRPFAERAAAYDQNESSEPAWWHTERPTIGDLRRARTALEEKQ